MAQRAFRIVLIKPSHYDDDGYVIQWWRSSIPSDSLASVYGLLQECAHERVLGPDVDIEIEAMTIFSGSTGIEGVHPLQFGFVRRKVRMQRRHGMPLESPLIFYPRRAVEASTALWRWLRLMRRYRGIMRRVLADPEAAKYTDEALRPARPEDTELPHFVQVFADRIPKTYGAPTREAVAG